MSATGNPAGRRRLTLSRPVVSTPAASARTSLWARARTTGWRRVRLGVIVHWQAARLDRELAAGVSVRASDAHALRALRITGRRRRTSLARGLTRIVHSASASGARFTSAVPPDRRAVLATRPVIEALERRLRGDQPVAARGMAMLAELLTEPTSPLYRPEAPGALGSRLRAAAVALEPGTRWE